MALFSSRNQSCQYVFAKILDESALTSSAAVVSVFFLWKGELNGSQGQLLECICEALPFRWQPVISCDSSSISVCQGRLLHMLAAAKMTSREGLVRLRELIYELLVAQLSPDHCSSC